MVWADSRPRPTQIAQYILGSPARGQHQHGMEPAPGAQGLRHEKAVDAGEHDVENHRVERLRRSRDTRQGILAVLHDVHVMAFKLKVKFHPGRDVGLVFADEDMGHVRRPQWPVPPESRA
jgi:hypothetical protein